MTTIKEDYVPFEIAKLLKEKGFPQKQENSGYYATEMVYCTTESKDGTHHFCHQYPACCDKKYEYICAPTLQMAMKWLRQNHNLHVDSSIYIDTDGDSEHEYSYTYWDWTIFNSESGRRVAEPQIGCGRYDTYEQSCIAGIKHCLEQFILTWI